jgi:hypothetical protein
LKTDYRDKTRHNGLDATKDYGGQEVGREIVGDDIRISMARQWYEKVPQSRKELVRDLFIAGLNDLQVNPVREHYHRYGFNHPVVMRAFMLHVAVNLEKNRGN